VTNPGAKDKKDIMSKVPYIPNTGMRGQRYESILLRSKQWRTGISYRAASIPKGDRNPSKVKEKHGLVERRQEDGITLDRLQARRYKKDF
jgi:hypothetical protein